LGSKVLIESDRATLGAVPSSTANVERRGPMKVIVRPRSVHPHRWVARVGLMATLLAGLAACGAPTVSNLGPTGAPATASDADGRYSLSFTLPKATYADREEITGTATLVLEPGPDAVVGGSTELLTFGFAEVGGSRQMGPASDAVCAKHVLSAGNPLTSRIVKSGGYSDDMPDADFYVGFFADPAVRLPPGDWDITAYADLIDGKDCAGAQHNLNATVRVHVTDAAAPSP
jgi:hypothetical protein